MFVQNKLLNVNFLLRSIFHSRDIQKPTLIIYFPIQPIIFRILHIVEQMKFMFFLYIE